MELAHVFRPGADVADAMEHMATAVVLLDAAGTVTFLNAPARVMLGDCADRACRLPEALSIGGVEGAVVLPDRTGPGFAASRVRLSDGRNVNVHARALPAGGWVLTFDDVSAFLRDAELARNDPLTGLANRVTLDDALAEKLSRGEPLAVLCIDLDRFKSVNDTLGHPVGDVLLRAVGDRLRGMVRTGDIVARLGGDEFALLIVGASPEEVEAIAVRAVDLVGRAYVLEGHMINVGASVGIALAPSDATDSAVLMRNADLALYRAKEDGRGTFRFFESGMDARMQERRALEIELRRALAIKEFTLAFQPQIRLELGEVVGFEALLRWDNPSRGPVSPADFIPLAEEIGLMPAIGEWVLRTACREAATWSQPLSVAVNISPLQFRDPHLVEKVMAALRHFGLDPARLELEITEGSLIEDTGTVVEMLGRLRAVGVRVSMDDFGTGYSSLSYLQKFPFDKIKVDQSFVRGMLDNPECTAIVRAIARLGESLGMKTTAEGVETAEQLAAIRAEGCTEVQGYLTGRPLTAEAAAALVSAGAGNSSEKGECA